MRPKPSLVAPAAVIEYASRTGCAVTGRPGVVAILLACFCFDHGIALATPGALTGKALRARPARPDPSRITAETRPSHTIPETQWARWRYADHLASAGEVLNFSYGAATVPQQIVPLPSYSRGERRLIRRLMSLSSAPKTRKRAYWNDWSAQFARFRRIDSKYDRATLKEFIDSYVKWRDVEVGAWRLTLASGRVITAKHSSSDKAQIANRDFSSALNGLLRSPAGRAEDIVSVQYFHTHPGEVGGPLSKGDFASLKEFARAFAASNTRVPIHIYAIREVEGELMTFHSSVTP